MTEPEYQPGRVEQAVQQDLSRIRKLDVGSRGSLARMAIGLAQAIDGWGVRADSAASLSALARAHGELRATLSALMEAAADDDRDPAAGLPAPVWLGAERSADAGRSGGGDSGASG